MRLLFCKIFDEKSKHSNELIDFGNRPNEDTKIFAKRIKDLFDRVKAKYSDIFEQEEEIDETNPFFVSAKKGQEKLFEQVGITEDENALVKEVIDYHQ